MLLGHTAAYGYRGQRCRNDPRGRHRRESHAKHPAKIRMKGQIECGGRADADAQGISDSEDSMHDGRSTVQSKPELSGAQKQSDSSSDDMRIEPFVARPVDAESARVRCEITQGKA